MKLGTNMFKGLETWKSGTFGEQKAIQDDQSLGYTEEGQESSKKAT